MLHSRCVYACIPRFLSPERNGLVRIGGFYRRSDHRYVTRYRCKSCRRSFSSATREPEYRQKKRHLNSSVSFCLVSCVSQRRVALGLGVNLKTAVRKFRFIADQSRRAHADWQLEQAKTPRLHIQFDDLETAEHTKCKPLSVALAVDPKSRKILSFQVSRMPAKGPLAQIARRKYGHRRDDRSAGWTRLMKEIRPMVIPKAELLSDENPHYPRFVKRHLPKATHRTVPGARGCGTGQGELKKLRFDPLFALNHTCAMLRANINRLVRRTWSLSKTLKGLEDHLAIYVVFHNTVLTE